MRIGFTGTTLDRCDDARHDPDRIATMRADPAAGLLRLDGLDPVIENDALGWGMLADAPAGAELALLGTVNGAPSFVALTPHVSALRRPPGLIESLQHLPPADAALYATARSLVDWHARHGFCSNCGTATTVFRAGWGRSCPDCKAEHFPRTDPVVIMLAEHDGRILVGRQKVFPPRVYSALAGFLEPGESIEEAVARELFEEAGVRAGRVRYLASQPWPFPSQLMIGCVAEVPDDALTLDQVEIEDAMWLTRDEVRAALAYEPDARFLPPPPYAIAHSLLAMWSA